MFRAGISEIFRGEDGLLSGKRIIGTTCMVVALVLTVRASIFGGDLSGQAVLIAPIFGAGLAMWGITSMASYYQSKLESTENISNRAIEENASNPTIEIKQNT
jgi:hypothetical protein